MQKIIVVGAGILGASAAYHLAKAGVSVTLVDREEPGQATDSAVGFICPWLSQRRNKAWYSLAKSGAKYYPTLIKQLEEDGETNTGYKQVGAISIHSEEDNLQKMEERAYKRRDDAPEIGEITRLTPSETQKLFPPLADNYGSVHISGAARVNGKALRQSLINAAKKHGATYVKGDATLVCQENTITGIKVDGQAYHADQVILATGAWTDDLLKPLGVKFLGSFQKGQIIHLQLPNADTNNWPVVLPPIDQGILAFDGGRVVIGATHENETGLDMRVTAGGIHEVLNKALHFAPGLADGEIAETLVGFRPFTPGFLPVIGPLPNYEGIMIAGGLGASGITTGPFIGQQLANLALGQLVDLDLEQYSLSNALEQ